MLSGMLVDMVRVCAVSLQVVSVFSVEQEAGRRPRMRMEEVVSNRLGELGQ